MTNSRSRSTPTEAWPPLPSPEAWQETLMWAQIVGKIWLEQMPLFNHWWNVTLYVTCRGLSTSAGWTEPR